MLGIVTDALPSLLTAAICVLLYHLLSRRMERATFTAMDSCITFCLVTVVPLPAIMAAGTFFILNYAYTNFPDIRPQSWDISMIYSAVLQLVLTGATSLVGSGIACWKFVHRSRVRHGASAT
jgi:uncharacterized membrane protein